MAKRVNVKSYKRKTKSGRVITVKQSLRIDPRSKKASDKKGAGKEFEKKAEEKDSKIKKGGDDGSFMYDGQEWEVQSKDDESVKVISGKQTMILPLADYKKMRNAKGDPAASVPAMKVVGGKKSSKPSEPSKTSSSPSAKKESGKKDSSFNAGDTYEIRYIGDSELKTPVKILKRTDKTVWFKAEGDKPSRAKIQVRDGNEYFFPFGQYSMAPVAKPSRKISK